MADPFIGEIRLVSFTFPPRGWAQCNGQLLPINQNQALFSLLGTMYGGNGQTNFALPDLRGRVGVGQGQGPGLSLYSPGERGGQEAHTLLITELPVHGHGFAARSSSATTTDPRSGVFATPLITSRFQNLYHDTANAVAAPTMLGNTGGSQPHENRQPFLCVEFLIALTGIFPSR